MICLAITKDSMNINPINGNPAKIGLICRNIPCTIDSFIGLVISALR